MMKINRRSTLIAAACLASLSVSACDQGGGNPLSNFISEVTSQDPSEKFNIYVEAYNSLIDDSSGIPEDFNRYQQINLPSASASSTIVFPESISTLETALENLKKGRAISSNDATKAVDAAVDKLIPAAEALLAQLQDLSPYYSTRGYRDDQLAKGKAAHESLIANYQATVSALKELDPAITTHQRAANASKIENYRKRGLNAEADVISVMQQADFFTTAVLEENTAEADRLLPALNEELTKLKASAAALPADSPNKSYIDLLAKDIEHVIGNWSDYKESKNNLKIEMLIDAYNRAVDRLTQLQIPA